MVATISDDQKFALERKLGSFFSTISIGIPNNQTEAQNQLINIPEIRTILESVGFP